MPKLKIFLMTRNEFELLEDWIKYHGFIFGLDNIHVLDGSDDPRIFDLYDKYKTLGLNVQHTNTALNGLANELSQLMHSHKGSGNFLIKLDTDEFLAHTSPINLSPIGRIASFFQKTYLSRRSHKVSGILSAFFDYRHGKKEVSVENFETFLLELPVTGQRYKASLTAWSIPKASFVANPCRDITEFTSLQFTDLKSFFHSDSFVEVDLGCHGGTSSNNIGFIDTGLTLIHYHSTSVVDSMRRARSVLISHEYIDEGDTDEQQRDKLKQFQSRKVASHHKIALYLKFLESNQTDTSFDPELLNRQHPYFRYLKSRQMTLVRDTLELIDHQRIF